MRWRDIMRTRVETASPRESAQIALDRMRRARIRHLVVQDGPRIVGVLSDRDIGALGSMRQVETVEDVMSRPALTSSPVLRITALAIMQDPTNGPAAKCRRHTGRPSRRRARYRRRPAVSPAWTMDRLSRCRRSETRETRRPEASRSEAR